MSIAQFFPFSKEVVWDFICQGAQSAIVKDLIFSEHHYRVDPYRLPKQWSKNNLAVLSSLVNNPKLAARVKSLKGQKNCFIVDKCFKVRGQSFSLKKQALAAWVPLERFFFRATLLNGSITASMLLFSFQDVSRYLIVASALGAIAFCFFTGYAGARYILARDQVAYWKNPGHHLALERTEAKEKDFVDLWSNKPKFLNPQGGLLPVEMHRQYVEYFKHFAQSFLDRKCSTPEEQYAWIVDFFKSEPHPLDRAVLDKLFMLDGYEHFTSLGLTFTDLQNRGLVVRYDNKRIVEAVAKLKGQEPAHAKEFEEYEALLLASIEEHYRQEAEKLKKAVLHKPVFLAKFYQISRELLQTAQKKILESKKVAAVNVQQIDPVPASFKISRDFHANLKFPQDSARAIGYETFLDQLQIRNIRTTPL
jgi:hypothetical protein